jgi:hypothetical protein
MPFYRITIFLKHRRPSQGIKFFDNPNIDAVTTIARVKAREHFGDRNVIEVEAAMLSNHCRAVKLHQEREWKFKRQSMWIGYKKE